MIEHLPYMFSELFIPTVLLLLWAGNIVGMIFGAIPGLNGTMAMMLFMPMI